MRKSSMHEPMFYLKDTYKEGYLIKSPPSKMFTSQTSWKTRYFVLSRAHENVFYLDYFKSKEQRSPARGKIPLEKIQNISIEPTDHSFWGNIQRMFKASPQNVIRIETTEREYFLIDNNEQSTKEWFEKIKFAYNNMERERNNEVQRDDLDREPQLESNPSPRPSSDPITHEEKDKAFIKLSEEETVDNSVSALKWKPHTLPSDLFNREVNKKENESISVPKWKPHTLSSEFSNSDINIKQDSTPIPFPRTMGINSPSTAQCSLSQSLEKKEKTSSFLSVFGSDIFWTDTPDSQSKKESPLIEDDGTTYMCMSAVKDTRSSTASEDSSGFSDMCLHWEDSGGYKMKQTRSLVEVSFDFFKEDLNNVSLKPFEGKQCVKDRRYSSYELRVDDLIVAVNDISLQDDGDFQAYIERALKDKVKLTVLRKSSSEEL